MPGRVPQVWDLVEGRLFYTLHGHEGAANACAFSPAGDFFASGGTDQQALVWKTNFDQFTLRPESAETLAAPDISAGQPAAPAKVAAAAAPPKPVAPPPKPQPAAYMPPPPPKPQPAPTGSAAEGSGDLAGTLEQVVGQLEILAQTVALLEQRLTLSEDRNARLEGLLKRALGQQ